MIFRTCEPPRAYRWLTATRPYENSSGSWTTNCPPSAKHTIDRHLDGCLDCLQAFDFHAELKQVIAIKARYVSVPDGLLARIEACFGLEADDILDS